MDKCKRSAPPIVLLVVGASLIFMTFMRFGVPELAWIVFAPLLVFLYERATVTRHVAVLVTLVIAFLAAVSKIATGEIPWLGVPLFALPIAASYFVAVSLASFVHRRLGVRWGIYTFASAVTALGWIQYRFTEGASWGILAHTQLESLPLVQFTALTGVGGVTFLVALGSTLLAAGWTCGIQRIRTDLVAFAVLLGSALVFGQLRLASSAPGPMIRVGGVVSPVTHDDFAAAAKAVDAVRHLDDQLFARSERAVDLGARAVMWNEVATVVTVSGEAALVSRAASFAQRRRVLLLIAYGVVQSVHPLYYFNKYRIYLPDGSLADEYSKRHPVPVDPSPKSSIHARVVPFEGAAITGAICYDYSFPSIARDNARDGGGLVLLPSSDWLGIDPEHGRMALMNAVAVGLPMVRPVRAATSIATDQYGRLIGTLRADAAASGDGVLVVSMPTGRVPTLYTRTGEIVPMATLGYSVFAFMLALRAGAISGRKLVRSTSLSPVGSARV